MSCPGIELMHARRDSLVRCLSSPFSLDGTLSQDLFSGIPMVPGTDSALAATGNLIDELQIGVPLCSARFAGTRWHQQIRVNAGSIPHCKSELSLPVTRNLKPPTPTFLPNTLRGLIS
jgi:hypothetical protein